MNLQVQGSGLPDLFQNGAQALLAYLIDPSDVSHTIREKIVIEAADTPTLLRDWLNALLELAGGQGIIFQQTRVLQFHAGEKKASLQAEITGELIDTNRHVFRNHPDAFRFSSVALSENAGALEARITFSPAL